MQDLKFIHLANGTGNYGRDLTQTDYPRVYLLRADRYMMIHTSSRIQNLQCSLGDRENVEP